MNSAVLLVPLFLIRYGLLALLNKESLVKAAYFPPMNKTERVMYWVYQAATIFIIVYMLFLSVKKAGIIFWVGISVYVLGIVLFALATVSFAKPSACGVNQEGLYRVSRNPMYIAYFIYFLGCAALTESIALLTLVCVFQISAHWVILAEERWCAQRFKEEYRQYAKRVRRYI